MDKIKSVIKYDKLSNEIKNLIRLIYPDGYSQHLISITDKDGKKASALRLETEERIFLIRVTTEQANEVVVLDDDVRGTFDDIREEYEVKYQDANDFSEEDNDEDSA